MGFGKESTKMEFDNIDEKRHLIERERTSSYSMDEDRINVDPNVNYFEKRRRRKLIEKYYEEQDHLIEMYKKDAELLDHLDTQQIQQAMNQEKDDRTQKLKVDKQLATIIVGINLLVFGGNLAASILSGSYSIISTFIDSATDFATSIIVHSTIWAINNTDYIKYPRGRERLELIAAIGCSIFMGSANILMIIQSAQAILTDNVDPDVNLPTLLIVLTSVTIKTSFMMECRRHGSSNSNTLAMDQRNDIMMSLVGFSCAYIGHNYYLYADPIGAILVCSYVAISWFRNAISHIPLIVGHQADKEEVSRVLAIALDHDDRIICLDHIMVYHVGEKATVELHIVLDESLPLRVTHDICERLQNKINSLNFVERTFIHVDHRCDGSLDGK